MTSSSDPAPTTAEHSARHAAEPSIGQLVHDASESLSTIIRGEIELAKVELRSSVKNAGVGAGMFIAAAVLLAYSLTFGLLALAEGLISLGLYRWLGYLVVFALLVVVVGLLVLLGVKKVKRVKSPQRTIETGRDTVAYLKSHPKAPESTP
ncbi:MAG TPA: phage holin family protein [Jatrophihabitans sp.]